MYITYSYNIFLDFQLILTVFHKHVLYICLCFKCLFSVTYISVHFLSGLKKSFISVFAKNVDINLVFKCTDHLLPGYSPPATPPAGEMDTLHPTSF